VFGENQPDSRDMDMLMSEGKKGCGIKNKEIKKGIKREKKKKVSI